MTRVMLDLETLGNNPGSVIIAIGAVKFGSGKTTEEFYQRVDAQSCVDLGLKMDVDTVTWWLQQSDEARKEIVSAGALPLPVVLQKFTTWLDDKEAEVWGNGAGFDNVLLRDAYRAAGHAAPWGHRGDRCYRTVKNLNPEVAYAPPAAAAGTGVAHHALDDARAQAVHLMQMIPEVTK